MSDMKALVYETPEAEVIKFDFNDDFLETSGGGGGSRGGGGRVCNFDVCWGVGWSCIIDRWLFGG